jgi:hypothetical protein
MVDNVIIMVAILLFSVFFSDITVLVVNVIQPNLFAIGCDKPTHAQPSVWRTRVSLFV